MPGLGRPAPVTGTVNGSVLLALQKKPHSANVGKREGVFLPNFTSVQYLFPFGSVSCITKLQVFLFLTRAVLPNV